MQYFHNDVFFPAFFCRKLVRNFKLNDSMLKQSLLFCFIIIVNEINNEMSFATKHSLIK